MTTGQLIQSLRNREIALECSFSAVRSGGPGGQHVNKTSSRVELRLDIEQSEKLRPAEKIRLCEKLGGRLTRNGELVITADTERSQFRNREIVEQKLYEILAAALHVAPKRQATRPTRASRLKRLDRKRRHAEKKSRRGKIRNI